MLAPKPAVIKRTRQFSKGNWDKTIQAQLFSNEQTLLALERYSQCEPPLNPMKHGLFGLLQKSLVNKFGLIKYRTPTGLSSQMGALNNIRCAVSERAYFN